MSELPANHKSLPDIASWQILDVGSIWMREFASALASIVPVTAWQPRMSLRGLFQVRETIETIGDPPLDIIRFPLQRGYARPPIATIFPFQNSLLNRLVQHTDDPSGSVLVLTTPFYAPLAERWAGPTVYYVTDRTASYAGINAEQVVRLDQKMCRVATAVCPNSTRLAEYLTESAGCQRSKITVVPNATRASNLSREPLLTPGPLPADIADLARPIAGVIGNLAGNMDWELLREVIAADPQLSWVFVGPTSMEIADEAQRRARAEVVGRTRFVGVKPYSELQAYARSFDVAVLPYLRREPTYSGSSTRFYEHLAACRPMVATHGFAELLERQPLVELVDSASAMNAALSRLRQQNFHDGFESLRWQASQTGTWGDRAQAVISAVHRAVASSPGESSVSDGHIP